MQICRAVVEVRSAVIFESYHKALSEWGVDVWNPDSTIQTCYGSENTVVVRVSAGLRYDFQYAISIAVTNPVALPAENAWTLSFFSHFKPAFPSFALWTFDYMNVISLSPHSGPSCYGGVCIGAGLGIPVPVKIFVKVRNRVDTDGELLITAPPDFAWAPTVEVAEAFGDLPASCAVWQCRDVKNKTLGMPRSYILLCLSIIYF